MLTTFPIQSISFEKVVIWGHKLHTHTHSYVHDAFFKAFHYLGYQTHWFDNNDDTKTFDFSNSLFITEGQVDQEIPIRSDCYYVLHNCNPTKYEELKPSQWIYLQKYTDIMLKVPDLVKLDTCIYYDLLGRCLIMPWATDLLPHEIEENMKNLKPSTENTIYWIGTIGGEYYGNINEINPFIWACKDNSFNFIHLTQIEPPDQISYIKNSYMAPTIVGKWQLENGYIPCRIFKNISYGKMGITNSPRINELFEGKLIFNSDTYQLFSDAKGHIENMDQKKLIQLMEFVKTKHTYVNRIHTILIFLDLVAEEYKNHSGPLIYRYQDS